MGVVVKKGNLARFAYFPPQRVVTFGLEQISKSRSKFMQGATLYQYETLHSSSAEQNMVVI